MILSNYCGSVSKIFKKNKTSKKQTNKGVDVQNEILVTEDEMQNGKANIQEELRRKYN